MANTPKNSVLDFISARKTLVMATVDNDGAPNASYAPFVQRTPWLYVYTSTRSKHTKNMTDTTRASVMFIEDETRTRNFFARERFTCQCRTEVVERKSKEWRTVMYVIRKEIWKGVCNDTSTTGLYAVSPHSGRRTLRLWIWAGIRGHR